MPQATRYQIINAFGENVCSRTTPVGHDENLTQPQSVEPQSEYFFGNFAQRATLDSDHLVIYASFILQQGQSLGVLETGLDWIHL